MTDKDPDKNISDFFAAARKAAGGELERKEKERLQKVEAAKSMQMDLYKNSLQPIVDAIAAVPEKNGSKFSAQVGFKEEETDLPKLSIRIKRETKKECHELSITRWMFSELRFSINKKDNVQFITTGYVDRLEDAIPALGEWFAKVAPDRIEELRQTLAAADLDFSPTLKHDLRVGKPLQLKENVPENPPAKKTPGLFRRILGK